MDEPITDLDARFSDPEAVPVTWETTRDELEQPETAAEPAYDLAA